LFGAVAAGVLAMVRSQDPSVERARFRSVMLTMMVGMLQVESTQ
jgi:hypothetical protein